MMLGSLTCDPAPLLPSQSVCRQSPTKFPNPLSACPPLDHHTPQLDGTMLPHQKYQHSLPQQSLIAHSKNSLRPSPPRRPSAPARNASGRGRPRAAGQRHRSPRWSSAGRPRPRNAQYGGRRGVHGAGRAEVEGFPDAGGRAGEVGVRGRAGAAERAACSARSRRERAARVVGEDAVGVGGDGGVVGEEENISDR